MSFGISLLVVTQMFLILCCGGLKLFVCVFRLEGGLVQVAGWL